MLIVGKMRSKGAVWYAFCGLLLEKIDKLCSRLFLYVIHDTQLLMTQKFILLYLCTLQCWLQLSRAHLAAHIGT